MAVEKERKSAGSARSGREQRLEAELRANLKRRKEQARARTATSVGDEAPAATEPQAERGDAE